MKHCKAKVVVALSGGVDSSVAAALLKESGYDVVGIAMEIFGRSDFKEKSTKHACYGPSEKEDIEVAAAVCRKLAVPFHVIDLRDEYRSHVLDYVRQEYLVGRTPNPCIMCNKIVKFGYLLKKARDLGIAFDFFATGHYAQIDRITDRFVLRKAADLKKDQTYFLYRITHDQLSKTLFPIGPYAKNRVREIARTLKLESAERVESQDFIDREHYSSLFGRNEVLEGPIVNESGVVLGRHRGIILYTVGQRHGLGIASHRPLYVLRIDAESNRIVVGDKKSLYSYGLVANKLNLITCEKLDRPYKLQAKIRSNHKEVRATVFPKEDNKALVLFEEPQLSITPGQSVVLYSNDLVFGGGIIERSL